MNWKVYDEFYKYSHFWQLLSLFWLLVKDYEIYEVFMISIMKLMIFMKRYFMWKVHSHIIMIYPLWSLMFKSYSYWLCHFVAIMLRKEDVYVHESLLWLKLLCFLWCLTIEVNYYFFYMSFDVLRVSCGILT